MSRRRRRRVLRVFLLTILACFATTLLPTTNFNIPKIIITSVFMRSLSHNIDVLDYVDPLIGTINGGHVFPGATLPYGMAKAVADSDRIGENIAGFVSDDSKILGFSQLHDSGTGGASSLGNFPLFAHPGCPEDDFTLCQYGADDRAIKRIHGSVRARPGYFALELENSIFTEVTTTHRTSLYRFNFPQASNIDFNGTTMSNSPLLLLDVLDLAASRTMGKIDVDAKSGRISGNGTFMPSFGTGEYTAYFCVDFRGAEIRNSGYFRGNDVVLTEKSTKSETKTGAQDEYRKADYRSSSGGGWVQFHQSKSSQIMARVGLSFMSTETACRNAEEEIPDFDFDRVVGVAQDAWREKLSVIKIDAPGVSDNLLTTFWSGIYRTMISPQNYTNENPLWDSDEPYFDSFYCIWDSFRVQHPLLTLIDPAAQTEMVRTLIDIYKHEGKLPDCRMAFSKGITQGGSNADILLADAFVKGLRDGIDWQLGYEAVVSDAEIPPEDYTFGGRGNLASYNALGYVPSDDIDQAAPGPRSRTVSRSIEYAYDDFAIASIARGLGKHQDKMKYFQRSRNWKLLFDPDALDRDFDRPDEVPLSHFKGFPQPRKKDGTFEFQPSRLCSPLNEGDGCHTQSLWGTYEGSPWLYQFFVPQDMAALIELLGGPEAFVERLDYFHSSGIIDIGNEQAFLPTYQFHYAGRPGRSSYWIHQYIPAQFNSSINGIPGNDDCAMGAFTAFAFMGFFPVAGQDIYLLSAPLVKEVRLPTVSGRPAIIRNVNFDPAYESIYIESAKLDGKPYTRNWIKHDFFIQGGVLEFVLRKDESSWGTREEDLPPSLSTGTIPLY
ncbi:putative Glycoside hydrolase family 92 protein [Seiridium unicorne]|uniref:Glycoside hydrolase family 92 protein n=1 Tax=Seiridium unicorne TaxID=138068 RepID=A0ABR2UVJ2_9PEZI